MKYCNSLTSYSRFKTREVMIGGIGFGGNNPIRVQSMTTTDTMDTIATVEESIRMIEAGCELVRITAPSKRDAENLKNIKEELLKRGYNTPIVADIHFTPNAAEIAAKIVEKVRVNPGNYADKKKFEEIEYTDKTYQDELNRIREKFTPLVKICKEHGTAMRIGTNHGSLSDRILSRYGDTPKGMVESAMEFLRICRDENYHEIILSMKASNTRVMVQAYRLLVAEMIKESMNYPLHLGVTEAGEAEDGRIKSAVGIGALLEDGIGDTIRVSLTEAPEHEMPVAFNLLKNFTNRNNSQKIKDTAKNPLNPFEYSRRKTNKVKNIGGNNVPIVISNLKHKNKIKPSSFFPLGYQYSVPLDKWNINDQATDYIFLDDKKIDFEIPGTLRLIYNFKFWKKNQEGYPLLNSDEYLNNNKLSKEINFIEIYFKNLCEDLFTKINKDPTAVLIVKTDNVNGLAEQRRVFIELINRNIKTPVIISRDYNQLDAKYLQLNSSSDIGGLLIDGLGDGITINNNKEGESLHINSTAFGILQASRTRISKTEYISCPSCGRTLFDLQETTAKIRKVTDHLKGVKIGIMGCIVNGPGEMADADYGYVGTRPGKITLYKEKTVVKKNIDEELAVNALIDLIKEHGDWVEKK
ncbi:(E)-4-hydroxy-3-methylbut-2-enyl-diphosphate synthase [Flavobacteriales bacterium]|nr:(E)-4-hydroxy-3-methylbut-2-enyl-diphosphate synthase [Flavobacteriales bacterium]